MDYFSGSGRRRGNSSVHDGLNPSSAATGRPLLSSDSSRESMRQNSTIRLRRLPSGLNTPSGLRPQSQASDNIGAQDFAEADPAVANRRRSTSAPQRPSAADLYGHDLARQHTVDAYMPSIIEGQASAAQQARGLEPVRSQPSDAASRRTPSVGFDGAPSSGDTAGPQAMHSAGNAARANRGLRRYRSGALPPRALPQDSEYDNDVVNFLELVDPEVQTLSTLNNVQNSLFVPDLGRLINRRPTYDLSKRQGTNYSTDNLTGAIAAPRARTGTRTSQRPRSSTLDTFDESVSASQQGSGVEDSETNRRNSVTSQMTESHFAVLPHGVTLDDWAEEDIAELNDHVRHLLHSRREGFKRSMRGFKQYVSKPLGLFVTVYATLVTIFGLVWVLFIIGWLSAGSRQDYVTNIVDNILVALFALMGDGLAPFRAVDTYHMCFIAHYHHFVWDKRKEKALPDLQDHNDLPDGRESVNGDLEAGPTPGENKDDVDEKQESKILSPTQRRRLQYHQAKFSKSHTFYKPHETATHHAFPLRLLVAIVVLLDCHSLFQVALGTCTWSIDYRVRSEALTTVILCCSLTCNITAGILVSIGDKRTRKKDVLDKMFRQNLTKEAIKHIQQRHETHDDNDAEDLGVGVDDDAVLGDVQGLKISRKSMDVNRDCEGRKSMDRTRKSMDGTRKSMDHDHGRKSMDARKKSSDARREAGPSRSSDQDWNESRAAERPVSQF